MSAPQIERLWELVLEFRYGIERINVQRRHLMETYHGYSPELESLNQAVQRANKDIEAILWAIKQITGEVTDTPPPVVDTRVRGRLMLVD